MSREFLQKVIEKNGEKAQLVVAMEEMAELIKELSKAYRGKGNVYSIAEEIADVEIMLEQLRIIFSISTEIDDWKIIKLNRIKQRMESDIL